MINNILNGGQESHVQHSICLIEDQETHAIESDGLALQEVHQPSGSGNQNVALGKGQVFSLMPRSRAAVNPLHLDSCVNRELTRFLVYLQEVGGRERKVNSIVHTLILLYLPAAPIHGSEKR